MFVTRDHRDRCIALGFELSIFAILAILLLLPSPEFVPLLPASLNYLLVPTLAAGLILILVGCLARADGPRR
jgi:hypothetical protein